jgi:hypothetical protein
MWKVEEVGGSEHFERSRRGTMILLDRVSVNTSSQKSKNLPIKHGRTVGKSSKCKGVQRHT